MNPNIDPARLDEVRSRLRAALELVDNDQVRETLAATLQLLDDASDARPIDRSSPHAGSVVYAFEDENYEPFGREIDIQIDYDWDDYDQADEPFASWGPTIVNVSVLAVRYLDENGNEVPANVHYAELAGDLLNKHHEQLLEACTEHGYQQGVGRPPSPIAGLSLIHI